MVTCKLARDRLRSPVSNKEKKAVGTFLRFSLHYKYLGCFDFPKQKPSAKPKEIFSEHYALDELWEMTQRLKLRPLTYAQEADRQVLERFIASAVRLT